MANNEPQQTDNDEYIESRIRAGWSKEQALAKRWRRLTTRPLTRQIFELLKEHGEMSLTQIASKLGKTRNRTRQAASLLRLTNIVEAEKRGSHVYLRLRPGMVEQFQQWLESQKSDEPMP